MKKETFYGITSKRGCINGNLVQYEFYFNSVEFHLYVSHRVAQCTSIHSTWKYHRESYSNYDRYDFNVDSRRFNSLDDLFECFVNSIISIDKYIDMESYNVSKVSEELLRVLG